MNEPKTKIQTYMYHLGCYQTNMKHLFNAKIIIILSLKMYFTEHHNVNHEVSVATMRKAFLSDRHIM